MSKADVTFHAFVDGLPHHDICEPGKEQAFSFACPFYNRRCGSLVIRDRTQLKQDPTGQAGTPMWVWDGNATAPTFSPSINCKGCWHGCIRAGRCVSTAGRDEPDAAQHK